MAIREREDVKENSEKTGQVSEEKEESETKLQNNTKQIFFQRQELLPLSAECDGSNKK